MEQVELNEYAQALSLIVSEQQRQLVLAAAGIVPSGGRELSEAAEGYLSQAIAILTGPRSGLNNDPVPLLARAGALIALELARIVRIRKQVASGELVAPVLLEGEGSDTAVHAFRVTNPFTGGLAGLLKDRDAAEALLRTLLGPVHRWELKTQPTPPTMKTPDVRFLASPGGIS